MGIPKSSVVEAAKISQQSNKVVRQAVPASDASGHEMSFVLICARLSNDEASSQQAETGKALHRATNRGNKQQAPGNSPGNTDSTGSTGSTGSNDRRLWIVLDPSIRRSVAGGDHGAQRSIAMAASLVLSLLCSLCHVAHGQLTEIWSYQAGGHRAEGRSHNFIYYFFYLRNQRNEK